MIAVALLALALWVPGTLYPMSDAAHAVFRVAVCLAAAGGIAIPRGRLVRWGLALWGLGIVASVAFASDPWRAVWSTHNRNEGAWQAAHYLLLVLVAAAAPRERLVRWLAIAAALSAAWGLWPAVGWVGGRLAGSTGNPLYLAPLALLGAWGAYRAGWRWLAGLMVVAALATGSKGVLVALLAAAAVVGLAKAPRVVTGLSLTFAAVIWVLPVPESGLIRLELGRVAAHGIAARPWGWGAEGFPLAFDRFWSGFAPTGETWHDRAHCLLLDRAIEWGLVGVAGWIAVVVAAWRRADLPERAAIAAYVGYSLTMFEMMWGAAGFAVLLGYTLRGRRPDCRCGCGGRRYRPRALALAAALLALVVGAAQLRQSSAARYAADFPAMQRAMGLWSPVGGDLVELYLHAQQTPTSLAWAESHLELRAPHATQQAALMAIWDRRHCALLRAVAPNRPDVRATCGGAR